MQKLLSSIWLSLSLRWERKMFFQACHSKRKSRTPNQLLIFIFFQLQSLGILLVKFAWIISPDHADCPFNRFWLHHLVLSWERIGPWCSQLPTSLDTENFGLRSWLLEPHQECMLFFKEGELVFYKTRSFLKKNATFSLRLWNRRIAWQKYLHFGKKWTLALYLLYPPTLYFVEFYYRSRTDCTFGTCKDEI